MDIYLARVLPQLAHVLLAVDDEPLRRSAGDYLSRHGYVTSFSASREAPDKLRQHRPADFLIVDAAADAEAALHVCHAVRAVSRVPIIVLSPRDDAEERIRGFDAGVDDYLVKPFNPRELIVRIKAVSRRASFDPGTAPPPRAYRFGEWRLDVLSHTLQHSDGSAHVLNSADVRLLEALVTRAQETVSRASLLQIMHGEEWRRFERSIEARVSRMRQVLRQRRTPGSPTLIRGVYGAGYVFEGSVVPEL